MPVWRLVFEPRPTNEIQEAIVLIFHRRWWFFSFYRDKDGPVVFVGDDEHQSIEIKVTVANRGSDPSYATSLYTSYPADLLDLDTKSREQVSGWVLPF